MTQDKYQSTLTRRADTGFLTSGKGILLIFLLVFIVVASLAGLELWSHRPASSASLKEAQVLLDITDWKQCSEQALNGTNDPRNFLREQLFNNRPVSNANIEVIELIAEECQKTIDKLPEMAREAARQRAALEQP